MPFGNVLGMANSDGSATAKISCPPNLRHGMLFVLSNISGSYAESNSGSGGAEVRSIAYGEYAKFVSVTRKCLGPAITLGFVGSSSWIMCRFAGKASTHVKNMNIANNA